MKELSQKIEQLVKMAVEKQEIAGANILVIQDVMQTFRQRRSMNGIRLQDCIP